MFFETYGGLHKASRRVTDAVARLLSVPNHRQVRYPERNLLLRRLAEDCSPDSYVLLPPHAARRTAPLVAAGLVEGAEPLGWRLTAAGWAEVAR
jgi:hypothetical protein